ncbi:MAG: signal recognition particle protein [Clostridiales bacterium]|jgi:signal recognition particle subunit SRP54|nr:signal recognition particle protein [Clostridiales bacterium]
MIFENLSEKIQNIFNNLRKKGILNEKDLSKAIREMKVVLLEADVDLKVVKKITNLISKLAIGSKIFESLTPVQHIVKILKEVLIEIFGSEESKLIFSSKIPNVFMLVGLQGSGKTTIAAKLGKYSKKQGKNPLLCACDTQRFAAVKQLQIVGKQANIPVFSKDKIDESCPKNCKYKKTCNNFCINTIEIVKNAITYGISNLNDLIIIDTAGRLQTDENLMNELIDIKKIVNPSETLLVIDSMIGQEATNIAETFEKMLGITGIILTKLDGDARGGAALSIREVTGKPIKFFGTGEKLDDLEVFHPERIVERILGMGDVLTLIEKAEQAFDEKNAKELEKNLKKGIFTYEDFLNQMNQIKKIGSFKQILSMLPGINSKSINDDDINEKKFLHFEAIINSMTKDEKNNNVNLNLSRKTRIAKGSGTTVNEVNILIKQVEQMQKITKMFSTGNKKMLKKFNKMNKNFNFPF